MYGKKGREVQEQVQEQEQEVMVIQNQKQTFFLLCCKLCWSIFNIMIWD